MPCHRETKVFLVCQPIDLRAGFDGLAAKAQQIIGADPFSGHVFIFRSKRGERATQYILSFRVLGTRGFYLLKALVELGTTADDFTNACLDVY